MSELPAEIAERYGKSPSQVKKRQLGIILAAGGFALLFVIWAIWANLTGVAKPLFKTTAYEILDDTHVSVSLTVTKPLNTNVICAIKALKQDYGIVAYQEVRFVSRDSQGSQMADSAEKITLSTSEPAVTGLVDNCWFY
ncbi:MAG: DUF4307 domain-containing protein [Micrococcales bacterium]|nr:DUF4307 domain-containing protein [Actinomycetota bacterium]NCA07887.1 DUF4307 domain-containing protein [Micrococcales bacterium]